MSESSDQIDFNFRYRPLSDTPDGILLSYLQSFPPKKRKYLILKALRAFYLVSAYALHSDFDSLEELREFIQTLQETHGDEYDELEHLLVNIKLEIKSDDWWKFETLAD